MASLSLAVIVKDEEATLGRVLACAAQFCDELVVVDTGSTDRTVEIARAAGARVEHFAWVDDFAAARNYAFAQCTGDWIIWLDADDVLPPASIEAGRNIKATLAEAPYDVIFAPYHYAYSEDGALQLSHGRERFIRRAPGYQWIGRIHETIDLRDARRTACPAFVVEHRTEAANMPRKSGRNLRYFEQYLDTKTCSLRELYLYASELHSVGRWADAIEVFREHVCRWPAGVSDPHAEPYVVRVNLSDCFRRLGNLDEALRAAASAVAIDSSRAEGYVQLGLAQCDAGNPAGAYPAFIAATGCTLPSHGGVVYTVFYQRAVLDAAASECKSRM